MKNIKESSVSNRKYVTEQDVLRKHHKFLRQSDSSSSSRSRSGRKDKKQDKSIHDKYGEQMAKKYYSKLFKQYALVDLTRYETGQIGCRWRTQKQLLSEKGESICGSLHCCSPASDVYEMNFAYVEDGLKKNALVKVSVCQLCREKLNHKKKLKKVSNELDKVKLEKEQ